MSVHIITTIKEMHEFSSSRKKEGKKIGFVPTMGFLHEGHLSLVKRSKQDSDVTVISVFVNPTQFAPSEDLMEYPRDFERDKKLLDSLGADVIFYPDESEIYPADFQTHVNVENITKILEGTFRPTYFKGVTTIVAILFNAVKPDVAFFGQKDAQQASVIKQMVKDLKMDIEICIEPIVRESDGLAMSSRNIYINEKERKDALVLYNSLRFAEELVKNGERDKQKIVAEMKQIINSIDSSKADYIEIVESNSFSIINEIKDGASYYILIACRIGSARLIDNVLITV